MTRLFRQLLDGKRDLLLVLAMVAILVVLFTPIPPMLLDVLLILNVSIALMILLLTFYTATPLSFSTFPSLLLMATLLRLSLNIAATRLILEDADAGRVIAAVGTYVVGGNYVIGLVVFLILVVVQYVVVTNGAQRVAEVAARFTLDSMPGKQMAIDADMNMGLIDDKEARRRRAQIEREASFYGAMDGATKFVKGDAIAGIIIILINVIGGLTVGIAQMGMSWGEALQTFTLLTVGDGIVTQIPSLVIAVATGIIITRAATDARLGEEISNQVLAHPRTLLILGTALVGVAFLPGLPLGPVLLVLLGVVAVAWFAARRLDEPAAETAAAATATAAAAKADDGELFGLMRIEPLHLQLGAQLAERFAQPELAERLGALRRQLASELGLVLPELKVERAARLAPDAYELQVHGVRVGGGQLDPLRTLAINPGGKRPPLEGRETREPTFGLPALWVDDEQRQFARGAGYTLVDPQTVLVTHASELVRRHAPELLTRAETERLLGKVRERNASLVEELVPTVLSYGDVQKVLQHLLREKVSIRNLEAILEVLVDQGKALKVAEELTERARERLGAAICQSLADSNGEVHVMTLAPELERQLLTSTRQRDQHGLIADPNALEAFLGNLARAAESMMGRNLMPVLLCPAPIRRPVRTLVHRALPQVAVLGLNEVPPTVVVRAFGAVGTAHAG